MSALKRLKEKVYGDPTDKENAALHEIIVRILKEEIEYLHEEIRKDLLVFNSDKSTLGIYLSKNVETSFKKMNERVDE